MKWWQVNNELERIWKEVVVAQFKVLSLHLPGGTITFGTFLLVHSRLYTNRLCRRVLSQRMQECQTRSQYNIKSCPTTRHEGTSGERKYSSYSFSTSALDGVEWWASRPGRALDPGEGPPVPTVQEAGWAPEPVWRKFFRLRRASSLDRPVVLPVARPYTDRATRPNTVQHNSPK
jgi:hypothetical protein